MENEKAMLLRVFDSEMWHHKTFEKLNNTGKNKLEIRIYLKIN